MGMKLLGLVVLALICLSYMEAEASLCETRSREFRGLCFRNDNCVSICEKEGFLTGACKGFILRCICAKSCVAGVNSPGTSGGGGGSPPDGGDGGSPPDGGDGGASPDGASGGDSGDGGAPPDGASGGDSGDGGSPPDGGADGKQL